MTQGKYSDDFHTEIKITVLIAKDDVDAAMVAVHDKFKMASVNMRKAADTEE